MAGDEPNIAGFAFLPFAGGETVYKWFEQGKGPAQSTGPASAGWRSLAQNHNVIAEIINQAVRDSGASWEGQAGDAARSSTSPLATWADVTGQSATEAGKTTDTIGQAYSDAKNKMQQPPSVPDKPFYNDYVPWDTDYDDKVEANQKVSNANIEAFNTYATTVSASTESMPTFISPDPNDANMQEQGGPKPPKKVEYPPPTPPPTPPPGGGPPGTGTKPPGSNDDTNLSGWKPPGTGDDTNPSKVDPGRYPPPPPNDDWRNRPPPPVDPNLPPGGRWDRNNPNDPRNRPGGPNDPRNRPGGPPGVPGRGGGGGGGAGGMKPPGIGGAAAAGLGKGPGGMGGAGFGGAAGVAGDGRGGAGGFGPAGAGAAGGRGAAGAGAMGGMGAGAGRGQGEEDKEHKSASYLQETEDIFGDGTMVAPPVIGG